MTGAEIAFKDHRKKATGRRRDYAPLPKTCWRCGGEPVVKGHASCQPCLTLIEKRAAEMRRYRENREANNDRNH
jgi:hypothetical protein